MLTEVCSKQFTNGSVFALRTNQGNLVETTETFLPLYTKDAAHQKTNILRDTSVGSRNERWMIGVSCMSGCPVRCKFCATGQLKKMQYLTADEIVEQVLFILNRTRFDPRNAREFKINYTRMGEPFLNEDAVYGAVMKISELFPDTHHYISTIGIRGSDFSWIRRNITLQLSLHSLDEDRRNWLIPYRNKLTIQELGEIRTDSNLKTTVNLTLPQEEDFSIEKLKKYFDPNYFFIKLSPINNNDIALSNGLVDGAIKSNNLL